MTIPNQQEDWKEKGFGWIPDLPDITDPGLPTVLNNEIRILAQESTSHIEEITDDLIDLIKKGDLLKKNQVDQVEKIRQKLLGETFFPSIKVYKNLRKGVPHSKQLLQLKQAFYFIYLTAEHEFKVKLEKAYGFFDNEDAVGMSVRFIQWLQEPAFDNQLEELVKAFQLEVEELDDGIVGPKTYTKLRLFLSGEKSRVIKVNLLCPSTLIPNEVLEEVFDHLIDLWICGKFRTAIKEAFRDFCASGLNQVQCIRFETIHATQLELEEFSQKELIKVRRDEIVSLRQGEHDDFLNALESVKNGIIQKSKDFDISLSVTMQKELEKMLAGDEKKLRKMLAGDEKKLRKMLAGGKAGFQLSFVVNPQGKFIEQFEKWFHIIEPLVSAFLQILSPLAKFDNFKQAIETGFMRLESFSQLRELENVSKLTAYKTLLSSYSPAYLSDQIEVLDELRESVSELFLEALIKIDRKRKEALKEKSEDFESFSFFSFLEDVLDYQYGISLRNYECGLSPRSRERSDLESLITAKEEVFEIDNGFLDKTRGGVSTKQSSQDDRVLVLEPVTLRLPIHARLLEKIPSCSNHQATFHFFLPGNVDLSYWCPPVKDQGGLNACTAFAGIALLEYFAQRRHGKYINLSPRFLYKVSRNLMSRVGDLGASVRQTMKALVLFGVPPEEVWPWRVKDFNEEPPAFCYAYAQSFQSLKYFRLDAANLAHQNGPMDSRELLLFQIKAVLAAGLPCMFGFTVYSSFYKEKNIRRGYVAYPSSRDQVVGGHAAVAVGYNDYKVIDRVDGEPAKRGAFLIRNSWGTAWGDGGYGWLPYEYVLGGLTADWWSLLKSEWFDGGAFGLGAVDPGTHPDKTEKK